MSCPGGRSVATERFIQLKYDYAGVRGAGHLDAIEPVR
jgi:hypothetical protein